MLFKCHQSEKRKLHLQKNLMATAWFNSWFDSPYYHQLYFKRDEQEAASFIDQLIDYLRPEAGSFMLDMACGKGRHAKQLADKGFNVTGLDLSFNSISEAKKNETENLHFFQHDMRLPFWINYFDYCFNFFTSLGYFRTKRENNNAIRTMAQSLNKKGTLVIDYLNVHYVEDHFVYRQDKKIDNVYFRITKWMDENFFYKKIEIEDNILEKPLIYTEKVAKFSLDNFTDMLGSQNMQVKEVFGDYKLNNYQIKNSPRMVIVVKHR